jgi:hypothetical protein
LIGEKKIPYDVIYVLETVFIDDIIRKNTHLGCIYINYFKELYGDSCMIAHKITLDKFNIIGNVILMERDDALSDLLRIINVTLKVYYEYDVEAEFLLGQPSMSAAEDILAMENTLTMEKRKNNILPTLNFKYRLIDYVFDYLEHDIVKRIISNPIANSLLGEIWYFPIYQVKEILTFKFNQFKENNKLAKFELGKISVIELGKNIMLFLTRSIEEYNLIKTAYKLLFQLISKCIIRCNMVFELEFSRVNSNKKWHEIYHELKPIMTYINMNGQNAYLELYKLFKILEYYGRDWKKLSAKLTSKYNLHFDPDKLPSESRNTPELPKQFKVMIYSNDKLNNPFPKSIKSYKQPRFNVIHPIKLYHIDGPLCSHDITNKDIFYIKWDNSL